MIDIQSFKEEFHRCFYAEPQVFQAPGRVNLIGEHTDYNEGFVMPIAIDFSTWVGIKPRSDRKITIHSQNFDDSVSFELPNLPAPKHHWSDYAIGVIQQIAAAGIPIMGADILVQGEVPIGAGLSSSASIEVAIGFSLVSANQAKIDRTQLALLCQRAEHEFVGVRCGIMDQFISCHGQRDRALMLDCRTLEFRLLPLPKEVRIVICNTMVKHQLAGGEYNQRRAACEEGVRIFQSRLHSIRSLRNVSPADLERYRTDLPELIYRRCRHVVTEDERVQQAALALATEDIDDFGKLMGESHASLRDDYQVSCRELDLMVEIANRQPGIYGARMTGAGFGGCTVNMVAAKDAESFRLNVAETYQSETGLKPEIYITPACDGVAQVA